jgi:hypothetical protein
MGWAVGKASLVASPYVTYPLTILATYGVTRFR